MPFKSHPRHTPVTGALKSIQLYKIIEIYTIHTCKRTLKGDMHPSSREWCGSEERWRKMQTNPVKDHLGLHILHLHSIKDCMAQRSDEE